jgi:hypothetical protein
MLSYILSSLMVFENRVLRSPEEEEEKGGWRKFHNEELHNLYPSLNRPIIRATKLGR